MRIIMVTVTMLVILLWGMGTSLAFEKKRQIRYAFSEWPPMSYIDVHGKARGLYLDVLREVFEYQMNIVIVPQQLPWKRAQVNVKTGEADFMLTVATDERLMYAEKSELPFYELYLYVFTYAGHPKLNQIRTISSAHDIKTLNLIAVTNLGNGWHKDNIDSAGVTTRYLREEENALKFLASRRGDIMIDGLAANNDAITKLGLQGKVVATEARFGPIPMYLLVSRKSPYVTMMPEINQTFRQLKENGVIDRVLVKYHRIE